MPPTVVERFLSLTEVISRTTLSRSSIYAKAGLGEFPKPIKLGRRKVGWLESEIEAWMDCCILQSRGT